MLRGGVVFIAGIRQFDQARFGDGGNLANFGDDAGIRVAIEANERDGVGAASGTAAAKSERGNVHAEAAEGSPDGTDNAGNVAIAGEKHGAFEARFDVDAVETEDTRRAIGEDGAFGGNFGRVGRESNLDGIREAALSATDGFFDQDAARGGSGGCVDKIYFF